MWRDIRTEYILAEILLLLKQMLKKNSATYVTVIWNKSNRIITTVAVYPRIGNFILYDR